MNRPKIPLFLATLLLGAATAALAGGMGGQLTAQMTLTGGCAVSAAASGSAAGANFGTLDFGVQPSTFTGVLLATPSGGAGGAGTTQIVCSPDVSAMSVSVNAGNNPGQGTGIGAGTRAMRLGSASYLPYEVYSDAAMTSAYPTSGGAVGVSLNATGGAFALPVFGRVHKTHAGAVASGTYADTLQVTLSW
ncbi:spore coat protein U domain-containing protein [Pseudorhodoferax sp.]|uniref:spore coat protein U domain-containing protein n=1 Tax=Pseudorhodoferax sp. TaxID=1993553 RepID=UPI002DD634F8|nr:spore coat protein U domain-containing protein [Pseudorhodoferax sp.]